MEIKLNDIFSLSTGKYIALEEVNYENNRYIFANQLDKNEEPTKKFLIFKCFDNGIVEEKKREVLIPLLNYFSEKVNDSLELISDLYSRSSENDR